MKILEAFFGIWHGGQYFKFTGCIANGSDVAHCKVDNVSIIPLKNVLGFSVEEPEGQSFKLLVILS